jgi:hypothetical protein
MLLGLVEIVAQGGRQFGDFGAGELMIRMLIIGYCLRAFVLSGGCARRSSYILHTAGSSASALRIKFLTIRLSQSIVTARSAGIMEADASRYHAKAPDEIDWSLPERDAQAPAYRQISQST